jgi:hypothetical protein
MKNMSGTTPVSISAEPFSAPDQERSVTGRWTAIGLIRTMTVDKKTAQFTSGFKGKKLYYWLC